MISSRSHLIMVERWLGHDDGAPPLSSRCVMQGRVRLFFNLMMIPSPPTVNFTPCCTNWRLMTTPC